MKRNYVWLTVLALFVLLMGCSKAENNEGPVLNQSELVHDHAHNERNQDEHEHEHGHEHEHEHEHDHQDETKELEKKIYNGYFEDEQVKDRQLVDWEGDWQSVYPYLQDGTLDEVFVHKAAHSDSQTFDEIKNYYEVGYKTTTERLIIENNVVTFYELGSIHQAEYEYDGYEILTYKKGNRGVRYVFKRVGDNEKLPAYIQFSDHIIAPQKSSHFHIYMGNDRDSLLEEVTNWPTYYASHMDGHTIAHEMMAH